MACYDAVGVVRLTNYLAEMRDKLEEYAEQCAGTTDSTD